jgi:hypothetical protein
MGHNGRVTSVSFSHDRKMVLSSSTDGTVRIWSGGRVDAAAVVISHQKRNPSGPLASAAKGAGVVAGAAAGSSSGKGYSSSIVGAFSAASGASAAALSAQRNRPFATEINFARFFYMDKFVMLVGSTLLN